MISKRSWTVYWYKGNIQKDYKNTVCLDNLIFYAEFKTRAKAIKFIKKCKFPYESVSFVISLYPFDKTFDVQTKKLL